MPYSSDENRQYVSDFVMTVIKPDSIMDVGAGSGTYADLLQPLCDTWEMIAVEVWNPYVERFGLKVKYDWVYECDIRDMEDLCYDLIIFGDVLEHMSLEDAKAVWNRAGEQATWGMISVPIVHWPQGAEEGNPYEVHVQEHLHVENMLEHFGPFEDHRVFDQTATFFKKFK